MFGWGGACSPASRESLSSGKPSGRGGMIRDRKHFAASGDEDQRRCRSPGARSSIRAFVDPMRKPITAWFRAMEAFTRHVVVQGFRACGKSMGRRSSGIFQGVWRLELQGGATTGRIDPVAGASVPWRAIGRPHCREGEGMGDVAHDVADGVPPARRVLDEPIFKCQTCVEILDAREELHEFQGVEMQIMGQRHAHFDARNASFADPSAEIHDLTSDLRIRQVSHRPPLKRIKLIGQDVVLCIVAI